MNWTDWVQNPLFWQGVLLFFTAITGLLYSRGWSKNQPKTKGWQLSVFLIGLLLLVTATISPLSDLALNYFSARAIQHILLTGLIPLCILVTNGFLMIWDGLPKWLQWNLLSKQNGRFRRILASLTPPFIIWVLFVISIWLWNDPSLIRLTREIWWVHWLEYINLIFISTLYWWHIAGAKPHIHKPMSNVKRMAYAYAGMFPTKLLGLMLLFGTASSESTAEKLFHAFGMGFSDPGFAAMIIWMIGGATYTYTATYLAGQWLDEEDQKPAIAQTLLLDEDTWKAPGLYKKEN